MAKNSISKKDKTRKSSYQRKVEEQGRAVTPRVQPLLPMNPAQDNYIECIKQDQRVQVKRISLQLLPQICTPRRK